jgi:hypothetical protein
MPKFADVMRARSVGQAGGGCAGFAEEHPPTLGQRCAATCIYFINGGHRKQFLDSWLPVIQDSFSLFGRDSGNLYAVPRLAFPSF